MAGPQTLMRVGRAALPAWVRGAERDGKLKVVDGVACMAGQSLELAVASWPGCIL